MWKLVHVFPSSLHVCLSVLFFPLVPIAWRRRKKKSNKCLLTAVEDDSSGHTDVGLLRVDDGVKCTSLLVYVSRTASCTKALGTTITSESVSRCGLAVRRYAGKQKDLGSIHFGSPFSSKSVVYGRCLVTLPTQLTKHSNVSRSCPP